MKEVILLVYLVILSIFDWRERKVPLILLCAGISAAFCINIYAVVREPAQWRWMAVYTCLGMVPGVFMMAIAGLTEKAGVGDGLILLNIGMIKGYRTCLLLMCFSVFLMALIAIGMLIVRVADRYTRIPYIPFLATVYLAEMLVKGGRL